MKKSLLIMIFVTLLLPVAPCLPQSATPSREAVRMQHRVEKRQALVNDWASQAAQQVVLSIAVGILGLAVSALQKPSESWARALTVGLGLAVSAITLCTKMLYPADFQTLRRAVDQANPIVERLAEMQDQLDSVSGENKVALEAEFETTCVKIDDISHRLLGTETQSDANGPRAVGTFLFSDVVHAQSKTSGQTRPSWTSKAPYSDGGGSYFVGIGRDSSLAVAKSLSLKSAYFSAANWIQLSQPNQQPEDPSPQLIELVQQESQTTDTWFSVEGESQIWVYYSRIRIPSGFRLLDVGAIDSKPDPDQPANPIPDSSTITLKNDSAVFDDLSGLTLVLKHMGFAPITAKLYVVAPRVGFAPALAPYSHDRKKAEAYAAIYKEALPKCDGNFAAVGDNEVRCYYIQDMLIKPKHDKSQHLGIIAIKGRVINLWATKFDPGYIELTVQRTR